MQFVTIKQPEHSSLAVLNKGQVSLFKSGNNHPSSMVELITLRKQFSDWTSFVSKIKSLVDHDSSVALSDVELDAPLRNPGKIICIGKNYAEHAREMGSEPPSIPVVFSKFNTAIAAPDSKIALPSISHKVDFEAELVVVIGTRGRNILRQHAMEYVFGYCCGNDISARDWQKEKPGGQWLLGKTFDNFAPIGPAIVTADDLADPHTLGISLKRNGEIMQHSNTSHLIFSIDYLIAHLSQFVTLEPGDMIFTGTPSGVGAGRTPPEFLKSGDQLEVEIDGLGILRNEMA